jgi:NodT family efflux transporter outer membrane factor (OMF) lipoprotein
MAKKAFTLRMLAAASVFALTACNTMPSRKATVPALPETWVDAPTVSAPETLTNWWHGFNDPLLNRMVDEALTEGPNVQIAVSKVREARAFSRQTIAAYLPQLSGFARGQYTEVQDGPPLVGSFQSFVTGGGGGNVVTEDRQMPGSYGPQISWEVPLFGRVVGAAVGARANLDVALTDVRAAQASLAADTVQAYVDIRAAQERNAALAEAAELATQLADILDTSAKAGFTAPADAADARRLAEGVKARLPDGEIEIRRAGGVLALLRGKAPGVDPQSLIEEFRQNPRIPAYALSTAPLAPADLIRARPDVAQAEARTILAAADLGIARTDLLPQLRLSGSLGVSDNLIGSALPERLAQFEVTPVISIPLFEWGQRWAAVRARDARFEQSLINYKSTVNQAVAEASGSLVQLSQGQARLDAARKAEAAAEKTAAGVRAAYGAGLSSLADRLRAEQQLIDARLTRIDAEARQASAAIAVYRAFGGGPPPLGKV